MFKNKFAPGCGCCGDCTITVTVYKCTQPGAFPTNTLSSGATVTLYDSGGVQVGSACTTDATGVCSFTIPSAGDYSVRAVKTGETTVTQAIPGADCGTAVILIFNKGLIFTVQGCGCATMGADVVVTQTAGTGMPYSQTVVTDLNGRAQFPIDLTNGQTFSATISGPHYPATTTTRTIAGSSCSELFGVVFGNETNYWCYGGVPPRCRDAMSANLFVTLSNDSFFGSLKNTTVTVPLSFAFPAAYYRAAIPYTGGPTTHLGIYCNFAANNTCVTPIGEIRIFQTDSGGLAGLGSALVYPQTSGTAGCPVAFTAIRSGSAALADRTVTVSE